MITDPAKYNSINTIYESKRLRAKIDLVIKGIAIALIIAVNIAALATIYWAIVSYCPIKAEALITSSFLVGIVGALVSLKVPTLGITNHNLNQFLNPIVLLGRGMGYLFFGPTILGIKAMDWTHYYDRKVANQISGELKSMSFEQVAEKYGPNISNLHKYGFLPKEQLDPFKKLYEQHVTCKMERNYLKPFVSKINPSNDKENPLVAKHLAVESLSVQLQKDWDASKTDILANLPFPKLSIPDFTKPHVRLGNKIISLILPKNAHAS